jgi:hypothetical protein
MRKVKPFGPLATVLVVSLLLLCLAGISDGRAQSLEGQEFTDWYTDTMNRIESAAATMATAIENYDCVTCEAGAHTGYEDATRALSEIEGYEVSSEMQSVKDLLTLALEDFKLACYHIELGAMIYDANELETAAQYVNSSIIHFEEIGELEMVPPPPVETLRRLQGDLQLAVRTLRGGEKPGPTPTPTPESPSYESIVAISCLLAMAYLTVRRRG